MSHDEYQVNGQINLNKNFRDSQENHFSSIPFIVTLILIKKQI